MAGLNGSEKLKTRLRVAELSKKKSFVAIADDAQDASILQKKAVKRKTGIAYRRKMKIKHREQIRKNTSYGSNCCWCGYTAAYVDEVFDSDGLRSAGCYVKYPKHSKGKQFWKGYSNRMIRRQDALCQGNQYRKTCNYHRFTSY